MECILFQSDCSIMAHGIWFSKKEKGEFLQRRYLILTNKLHATSHKLQFPTADCQLPIANCQLPTAYGPLLTHSSATFQSAASYPRAVPPQKTFAYLL